MNLPSQCYHNDIRCMSVIHGTSLIKYSNIIAQIVIYHGNSLFKSIDNTTLYVESDIDNLMLCNVINFDVEMRKVF